jgi:hypothetical protein
MQINKTISKICKDKFKRYIENTLYDYDSMIQERRNERFFKGISVWTKLKDKVSLATAWFHNKYNNIDFSKASLGYSDCIVHNNEELDELRRKKGNSIK